LIHIAAVFDDNGVLVRCRAEGHAGAAERGRDIVCAAVSVLMRAMPRAVRERAGIFSSTSAPDRGVMEFRAEYTEEGKSFLSAAGIFLVEGLKSVAEEYPQWCSMKIEWAASGVGGAQKKKE
jgi:uncharacterized protein YsxB (DUF464 family)